MILLIAGLFLDLLICEIEDNYNNTIAITDKSQLITDIQQLPKLYEEIQDKLYKAYQKNVK